METYKLLIQHSLFSYDSEFLEDITGKICYLNTNLLL